MQRMGLADAWETESTKMTERAHVAGLQVAAVLHHFIEQEALPGTGIAPAGFWRGLAGLVDELGARNRDLLAVRDRLQDHIDSWHREHPGLPIDQPAYERFLRDIGYLLP